MRFFLMFVVVLYSFVSIQFSTAIAEKMRSTPDGVLGTDDRRLMDSQKSPWSAVGKVYIQTHGIVFECTGTLIDPKVVVTSAHCVFNRQMKGPYPPSFVHFLAGYQLEKYIAHSVAECVKIHPDYAEIETSGTAKSSDEEVAVDYAFIILKEPINVPVVPILNADFISTEDTLVHAGYCCDRKYVLLAHDGCHAKNKVGNVYYVDCDTASGASGGPVFVKKGDKHYLAAIMAATTAEQDLNSAVSIMHERVNLEQIKQCK
jgi:protease YdgD